MFCVIDIKDYLIINSSLLRMSIFFVRQRKTDIPAFSLPAFLTLAWSRLPRGVLAYPFVSQLMDYVSVF